MKKKLLAIVSVVLCLSMLVATGAYAEKANAEAMQKKLKAAGFDAIIV